MVVEDEWPSAINACKEGSKNRRLDEDKRWDSREKEAQLLGRRECSFWW